MENASVIGLDMVAAKVLNAKLSTYVLADAGHCINMHYGATDWFAATSDWFGQHFPDART
jgi:hypothetical protein